MPIQSVSHIAEVSFKDHFLGAEGAGPVNGRIQVNHNTFNVTFADGRVRAKFASGNAFTNMFRSGTLSRFTQNLQEQYNTWIAEQKKIEQAKAAELAITLGFSDNPDADKVAAVIDEFKSILEEVNPPGKDKFIKNLDDIVKLASIRNTITRLPTGAECNKAVTDAGFLTHYGDYTKKLDEKGKKGYVVHMLDTLINGFLQAASQMKDKKTEVVDFVRDFDAACVEAKSMYIENRLARSAGLIKSAHSDSSKDLAYSITAEFKAIADEVREPYLKQARKDCEAEVRAKCADEKITDEKTIKDRIESKAQMIVLDKEEEIMPKILEEIKYYGKFALYEALAGAKRPVTEISKNPENGKWTVTTLVDKKGEPVLKPVSAYDIDRNFSKMVEMFQEEALAMGMVEYRTVEEEPVFASREDYLAEGVLATADGYLSGQADVAELAKLVRSELCFETDITDDELQAKVRQALDEIAKTKTDDPAETKKEFRNFVNTYADGSYLDQRNDLARLVNLVARRTEAIVDLKKTCEAKMEGFASRCAQMIRNAFPDQIVWCRSLQNYLEQTLRSIINGAFKDDTKNYFVQKSKQAFKNLMPHGVFLTDCPRYDVGHRAGGRDEVRLHDYIKYIMQCLKSFNNTSPSSYIRPKNG